MQCGGIGCYHCNQRGRVIKLSIIVPYGTDKEIGSKMYEMEKGIKYEQ